MRRKEINYLPESDLREALRRKYTDTPKLPAEFMERMGKRMERKPVKPTKRRYWAAAASLLIIIGIGYGIMSRYEVQDDTSKCKMQSARCEVQGARYENTLTVMNKSNTEDNEPLRMIQPISSKKRVHKINRTGAPNRPDGCTQLTKQVHPIDDNLHYACQSQADDSVYRAPSQMDEFIAKMATYNKVLPVPLNCTPDIGDTTIVGTAYVFPDDENRLDVFARLLQAACSYDSKSPGYLLNFSRKQFFFCLKDMHKQLKYLWIAERISGQRILLFCTHSPINAPVSSDCFQDYRDELTHTRL